MARPEGLEPSTTRVTGEYSNRLNYDRMNGLQTFTARIPELQVNQRTCYVFSSLPSYSHSASLSKVIRYSIENRDRSQD